MTWLYAALVALSALPTKLDDWTATMTRDVHGVFATYGRGGAYMGRIDCGNGPLECDTGRWTKLKNGTPACIDGPSSTAPEAQWWAMWNLPGDTCTFAASRAAHLSRAQFLVRLHDVVTALGR